MTVSPFQIHEAMHVYNRLSKLKPSSLFEKEHAGPQDVVQISSEAKKRQVLDQAQNEDKEKIRQAK